MCDFSWYDENSPIDDWFYHYNKPQAVPYETEALLAVGFVNVEVLGSWGRHLHFGCVNKFRNWYAVNKERPPDTNNLEQMKM